jgi:site-specific recombinase XerD
MRGMEAAKLTIDDLSLESGWVMIRQGKWKKDRRVPLNAINLRKSFYYQRVAVTISS